METIQRFPFAHTFSVVARDPETGEMGVAVQSHWFSVGSVVAWAEAGVGAVATQSVVDPGYGPLGLALMRAGKSPQQSLDGLLAADPLKDLRQVAFVNRQGEIATHTGQRCIADAGHIVGHNFSVQANMMANKTVWGAMAEAYQSARGPLCERMLAALEAAQAAGGDIRGKQSACILIVAAQSSGKPWEDRLFDLRVEDHAEPIPELRRLVRLQTAYTLMNKGDQLLGEGKVEDALTAYQAAAAIAPDVLELPFWQAVTLVDLDRMEEALPIFKRVFALEPAWAELLKRLPASGMMQNHPKRMNKILALLTA